MTATTIPSGRPSEPGSTADPVTLAERLQADLTAAMRSHDELRRDTLRMAISAAYNAEKAARRTLTDDEVLGVLLREVKTRGESVDAYVKAERADLAAREQTEIEILSAYLPQALSEDELRETVRAAIAETGAATPRDLGRVMAILSPRTLGRADGRTLSALVASELARAVEALG